jgi:hypothetical protein
MRGLTWSRAAAALLLMAFASAAVAHGIGGSDAEFVANTRGPDPIPFMYLGAKHMVTGYDHLLFLVGVIFYLFRLRQVALYVSLFSLGHSITLLAGVYFRIGANSALVDAVIGFSIVYKAFENLGGFKTVFRFQPDSRLAVFAFGLVHGFGLSTKLLDLNLHREGLLANLVSFNVGVELGQIFALSIILVIMIAWRRTRFFLASAEGINIALMFAGFLLAGRQLAAYFLQGALA